ncbi:hypothetical protein G879_04636 [Escherichia coli KOEGE 7 (16a)]|nr:ProQ/FINO family protein [Escherichia coli]ERA97910.1 hypothetical protein G879_04636 [Escherichia coli KOEGE 7 (16a)]
MTKRQRKNRKRINRLVELWPELFNREKPQPLKVEIPDDLIQDIAIRELAFVAFYQTNSTQECAGVYQVYRT